MRTAGGLLRSCLCADEAGCQWFAREELLNRSSVPNMQDCTWRSRSSLMILAMAWMFLMRSSKGMLAPVPTTGQGMSAPTCQAGPAKTSAQLSINRLYLNDLDPVTGTRDDPLLVVEENHHITFACKIDTDPSGIINGKSKLSLEGRFLANKTFPDAIQSTDCLESETSRHYYGVKKDIVLRGVPIGTTGFVRCSLGAVTMTVYFKIRDATEEISVLRDKIYTIDTKALFGDSKAKPSGNDVKKVNEHVFTINNNRDGSGNETYFFEGFSVYFVQVTYYELACARMIKSAEPPAVTKWTACEGGNHEQIRHLNVECQYCQKTWNVKSRKQTRVFVVAVDKKCSKACLHNSTCWATPVGLRASGHRVQFKPCYHSDIPAMSEHGVSWKIILALSCVGVIVTLGASIALFYCFRRWTKIFDVNGAQISNLARGLLQCIAINRTSIGVADEVAQAVEDRASKEQKPGTHSSEENPESSTSC